MSALEAKIRGRDSTIETLKECLELRARELAAVQQELLAVRKEAALHQGMNQQLAHSMLDRSGELRHEHAQALEQEREQHRRALGSKGTALSEKDAEIAQLRAQLDKTQAELGHARSPASLSSLWASAYSSLRGPPARMTAVWELLAEIKACLSRAKTPERTKREVILDFKKAVQREREDTGAAATEEDAVVGSVELKAMPSLVAEMRAAVNATPLIDKASGFFSPYDFGADVERKKSGGGTVWRLISAMVLAPWQRRGIARMRRSLASPFEETFRFGKALLNKQQVEERLHGTLEQVDRLVAVIIDVIVYVRQRGSQILSQLLQRLVVVARAGNGITVQKCKLFSQVGLVPGPDAADAALAAVAAAYLENFKSTYAALFAAGIDAEVCAVLAVLVDNFVTKAGQFATVLKIGDNSLTTATLQSLGWAPPPVVVGDLKKPSERVTPVCPLFSSGRLTAFFDEHRTKLLPTDPKSPLPPLFDFQNTWLGCPIPKSALPKVSLSDYCIVPSIEARSSSFDDYEKHVIEKHEDLAAGNLDDGHRVMCHDTEFILHFFRLLHKLCRSTRLRNYLIMPNEFHNEKHAGEAILQVPEHILFLYAKLWIEWLKYASSKWGAMKATVQAEADAAAAGAAAARAAAAGGGDAGEAEAEQAQESADSVAAAAAEAIAAIDEEAAAGDGAAPTIEGVAEALAAAAGGGGGNDDDDDEEEEEGATATATAEEVPEKMNLTSVAMLKKLGRPVLRGQVAAHCNVDLADANKMLKPVCISELERELELPKSEPKKQKSAAQSAMVNASRLLGSNNHMIQRWCGARMMANGEGGNVRGKVVARARQVAEAKKWVRTGASEGEVLEAIFSKSEVFKGIFLLIDVEISAVVLSMAHWSQGNIEPYFRLFPVLCQIVAADPDTKPNIVKVMHLSLERLVLYNNEHPDVLGLFGRGCLGFRETVIESHHSCLTHIIDKHTHDLGHQHYVRGTCLLAPVRKLEMSLLAKFGGKCKEKDMERLGNIKRKLGETHNDTNAKLDEFLYTGVGFEEMFNQLETDGKCSGEYADERWSEKSRNRLPQGQANFENALPGTVAWLKKQEAEEGVDPKEETLLAWLSKRGTTIAKVLVPELRRRGLRVSGNKPDLAARINKHAKDYPGGFKNADEDDEGHGKDCVARPEGFLGVMPS